MLQYISEKSTNLLIRHRIIETEQKEVYLYGFQLFYSTFITAFVIIMTSLLFKTVLSGFIFIGYFAIPRFYVGGYHAPTYGKCFLFTNTLFLCELLLTQLIIIHKTFYLTLFLCYLFSVIYLFVVPVRKINSSLKRQFFLLLSFEILFIRYDEFASYLNDILDDCHGINHKYGNINFNFKNKKEGTQCIIY